MLEETGVVVEDKDITLFGLWESCFPQILKYGPLRSHHLVVFYKAFIPKPPSEIPLLLQKDEVEAACWLDRQTLQNWLSLEQEKDQVYYQLEKEYQQHNTKVAPEARSMRDLLRSEELRRAVQERVHLRGRCKDIDALRFVALDTPPCAGSSQQQQTEGLQLHRYDMREEFMAMGHRFMLRHLLDDLKASI